MNKIMVEVDLFIPKGKAPNDWDFIKTLRLQVDPDTIEADSENIGLEIKRAVKEWQKG